MIFISIIVILCLLILTGLIYGAIFLITLSTRIVINKSETGSFRKTKKYNRIALPISICLSIILSCYYLFSNPSHNFKAAYIERSADKYILTIYRQRSLMAHDPVSLLQRKTYLDSAKFELPKSDGIIDGTEIIYKDTYFNFLKGSTMTIKNETLTLNLEYISNYDSSRSKLDLNGIYTLKWRR